MKKAKGFGLVLMLVLATACAPVVYESTHYERRVPARYVKVQNTHTEVYRSHVEVTLYADSSYRGVYFQPIQLVISDGQYVEIPVKNRRGRHARIFAHYHKGDLHFDSSRNCKRIPGSRGFRYAKGWDNGYRYGHINAGKDYDLTGLSLKVRSVAANKHRNIRNVPANVIEKPVKRVKNVKKQFVRQTIPRQDIKKIVAKEAFQGKGLHVKSKDKKPTISKQAQVVTVKKKTAVSKVKADKVIPRPHIVQKLNKEKFVSKKASHPKAIRSDSKPSKSHKDVVEKSKAHNNKKITVGKKHGSDQHDNSIEDVKPGNKGGVAMENKKRGKGLTH